MHASVCFHFPTVEWGDLWPLFSRLLRYEQVPLCYLSSKTRQNIPLGNSGGSCSLCRTGPSLLRRLWVLLIHWIEDNLISKLQLVSQLLQVSQGLAASRTVFADRDSFHLLPGISHRCSLYQQSSSCCPVSGSPRNLLVSFHLGKYRSDKQITSHKSQKNLGMWSFPCHFLFKNLSSFWCFYHRG